MNRAKQILVTLALLLFTFLNVYKLQMPVPDDDKEYTVYANEYLKLTGVCFVLICMVCMTGERNKLTDSLLMVNIGAYLVLIYKAYFHVAGEHNYYDWTYAGIAVICAIIYLIPDKNTS